MLSMVQQKLHIQTNEHYTHGSLPFLKCLVVDYANFWGKFEMYNSEKLFTVGTIVEDWENPNQTFRSIE